MFFLNLTAAEFSSLLGALGGLITALYLLDRSKRKKIVSTLRFWVGAQTAQEEQSRKRMREPWSLILQLISLVLLLLAIAQLQWGTRERKGRDHVFLVDTSSWAGNRSGGTTVLAREAAAVREYLRSVAPRDRVMIVRVDALATPATSFISDRHQLLAALDQSQPDYSALNITAALLFAKQAQDWSGGRKGEIVYFGPQLLGTAEARASIPSNLRVIAIPADRENCGIRSIGVKRDENDPNFWQAAVTVKNYGARSRRLTLRTEFGKTVFTPRPLLLAAGEEITTDYRFFTNTAGRLSAAIAPGDGLESDDRAALEVPSSGALRVIAYTSRPDILRPLLDADHRLAVRYVGPVAYQPAPDADLILLDQFAPHVSPKVPSLWLYPPRSGSPLPLRSVVNEASIANWLSQSDLGAGLHATETRLNQVEVFQTFESDILIGTTAEGPAVVARPGSADQPKLAVIGFDPFRGQLRYEVTTPLLFANLLRWLSPESFRTVDVSAGRVGEASVTLEAGESAKDVRVLNSKGSYALFTVRGETVDLFSDRPDILRILSGDRERVLSLTLPDIGTVPWELPPGTRAGVPQGFAVLGTSADLWKWLAIAGGLGLLIEWLLFGRRRLIRMKAASGPKSQSAASKPLRERELVSR